MSPEAIRKTAQRQTASSFKLSGLVVPEGYVRRKEIQDLLDELRNKS